MTEPTAPAAVFDADALAAARANVEIRIGGKVFHRRRKSLAVAKGLRRLLALQDKAAAEVTRAAAAIDDLDIAMAELAVDVLSEDTPDNTRQRALDRLEAARAATDSDRDAADEALVRAEEAHEAAYWQVLAHQLVKHDDGGNVKQLTKADVEHIQEHLDPPEIPALQRILNGAEPDPTPGSPVSSS